MSAPVQADEAFLAVDAELLVGGDDLRGADLLDLVVGGAALAALAVFFLQGLEPLDRVVDQVGEVVFHALDVLFDLLDLLVGLEAVVGGDALDADLGQARDVLLGHLAAQLLDKRLQTLANLGEHFLPRL